LERVIEDDDNKNGINFFARVGTAPTTPQHKPILSTRLSENKQKKWPTGAHSQCPSS